MRPPFHFYTRLSSRAKPGLTSQAGGLSWMFIQTSTWFQSKMIYGLCCWFARVPSQKRSLISMLKPADFYDCWKLLNLNKEIICAWTSSWLWAMHRLWALCWFMPWWFWDSRWKILGDSSGKLQELWLWRGHNAMPCWCHSHGRMVNLTHIIHEWRLPVMQERTPHWGGIESSFLPNWINSPSPKREK